MHREVTHNKFHASFSYFVEAIFDFFRRRMPQEWMIWRDTVTSRTISLIDLEPQSSQAMRNFGCGRRCADRPNMRWMRRL